MRLSSILQIGELAWLCVVAQAVKFHEESRNADGAFLPIQRQKLPFAAPRLGSRTTSDSPNPVQTGVNWCGAVQTVENITNAKGSWTVPHVSMPPSGSASTEYQLYQWVGIGGYTSGCQTILQAGTAVFLDGNETKASAWYIIFPSTLYQANINVTVGDSIFVDLIATSSTTGNVTIKNLSTGDETKVTVDSDGAGELCLESAEWITEDPLTGVSDPAFQPFAEFMTIDYWGCTAGLANGTAIDLDGATLLTMEQNSTVLCTPTYLNSTAMKQTY